MGNFGKELYERAVDYIEKGLAPMDKGLSFVLGKSMREDGFEGLYEKMALSSCNKETSKDSPSKVISTYLKYLEDGVPTVSERTGVLGLMEQAVYDGNTGWLPLEYREPYLVDGTDLGVLARYMDDINKAYHDARNLYEGIERVQEEFGSMENQDSYLQVVLRSDISLMGNFGVVASELFPLKEGLEETIGLLSEIRERVFAKLCDKADVELEAIVSYFKENEAAFQMMDMKLHDAFYYECRGMEEDFPVVARAMEEKSLVYSGEFSPFHDFCDMEYENFKEWCKEQSIDFDALRHQVGRTSSFYLHDEGNLVCLKRRDYSINVSETLALLTDEFGHQGFDLQFNEDGSIDRYYATEDYTNSSNNVEYIASGAFSLEVKKHFEDALKVHGYLKELKDNQVESFKSYLEGLTERILESNPEFAEEAKEDR